MDPAPTIVSPGPAKLSKGASARANVMYLLGPFFGLAGVLLLFSISPTVRASFLTLDNFRLVATQTVIVALGALGMTAIIISGGIDLSVGSVIALSGVVVAEVLRSGHSPVLAIATGLATGCLVGVINGALTCALRVTPFIVTLGTLGVARGAANWLAHEQTVNVTPSFLNDVIARHPTPAWLLVAPAVWLTLLFAVSMAVLLRYTRFGRYIFAIGSNEGTARLCGIRVDALKICIYGMAGLFFGIAGFMQFARLGQGDPTTATGIELDVIAAVVIGGGSLSGGEGSILGSILGALIMSFLRNGGTQMNWPPYVEQMLIGAIIVIAVALDRLRHKGP